MIATGLVHVLAPVCAHHQHINHAFDTGTIQAQNHSVCVSRTSQEIKNNIEEVRGVMKAQAEAAATKVTSPAAANGAAKTEVKEKELVSTRS